MGWEDRVWYSFDRFGLRSMANCWVGCALPGVKGRGMSWLMWVGPGEGLPLACGGVGFPIFHWACKMIGGQMVVPV